MTNPVGGVGSPAVTSPATTTATTSVNRSDQMDKDVFLQLLVAQMRYQDPNSPTSTTEFMAQTATFTQVEKLEQIAEQNASMVALQRSLSAGALVGQTVSYTDQAGATVTGTVGSVRITGDEPTAVVDGVAVPIGRLTEVSLPTR